MGDEEEALAAAKFQEQKDAFDMFLHDKEGERAPSAERFRSWNKIDAEPDLDTVDEPEAVVVAPATHAVLDPKTKSLHAYQKQTSDAPASGNHLTDVVAGTGVALVCMALVALVALLYGPGKPSSSGQLERTAPLVPPAREESLEMGGVTSTWAAQAVDQAVDAAQQVR